MMISIEQVSTGHEFYTQGLSLRYELFFKEFDLPESIVIDELEPISKHIVLANHDNLIAYGRLTDLGGSIYKISQVVVRPSMQRRGYGKALLDKMICTAKSMGANSIELNSQVAAAPLYKGLGFAKTGRAYASKTTGIPHVKMVLVITAL